MIVLMSVIRNHLGLHLPPTPSINYFFSSSLKDSRPKESLLSSPQETLGCIPPGQDLTCGTDFLGITELHMVLLMKLYS